MEEFFRDIEKLRDFLLENEVVTEEKRCQNCSGTVVLKICIQNNKKLLLYRCRVHGCQKRFSLFRTNIPLPQFLHLLYLLLSGVTYKQLEWWYGFSSATILRAKTALRKCYARYIQDRPVVLGGIGVTVEIDETVLSRRGIIRSPTSTSDQTADTVWIGGAIDNTPQRNFFLIRLANRRVDTLTAAFMGKILIGSVLHSDGYPSYPQTAENLALEHRVVNHTTGFVSRDGVHTNNQEGFWSHLKSSMRKEHGVHRHNIDEWLNEYTFKRRYLICASPEEFSLIFIELLKYLFSE